MKKKIKILMIDNSEQFLNNLHNYLEEVGYSIYTTNNYFTGLSYYEAYLPDLVITDIALPDTTGLELIINFKKLYPDCKIIAISTEGRVIEISGGKNITTDDCLAHAKNLGACGIFKDSINKVQLLNEINKQLL